MSLFYHSFLLKTAICCSWKWLLWGLVMKQSNKVVGQESKTKSWKMLNCFIELRGTAESGDNSLWVCHYERHPFPIHKVTWSTDGKILISAALRVLLLFFTSLKQRISCGLNLFFVWQSQFFTQRCNLFSMWKTNYSCELAVYVLLVFPPWFSCQMDTEC